ncbi:hypothetical protein HG530_014839 [Fusarium avenaceum]|nr:hypothetical protein HG530_014839 [Fusarium avenaceum]
MASVRRSKHSPESFLKLFVFRIVTWLEVPGVEGLLETWWFFAGQNTHLDVGNTVPNLSESHTRLLGNKLIREKDGIFSNVRIVVEHVRRPSYFIIGTTLHLTTANIEKTELRSFVHDSVPDTRDVFAGLDLTSVHRICVSVETSEKGFHVFLILKMALDKPKTYQDDDVVHIVERLARHKVPDVDIVVVGESKSPLSQNIRQPHEFRTHRQSGVPFILRRSSQPLLLAVRPKLVMVGCSDNTASFTISDHDQELSRAHQKILDKATSDRVIPLHVSNKNISRLHNIMLSSRLASTANLSMMTGVIGAQISEGKKVKVGEFGPVSAKLDGMLEITPLGHDGELKPAIARHGIFTRVVPDTLSTDGDLRPRF